MVEEAKRGRCGEEKKVRPEEPYVVGIVPAL
jgi:hypothetical protein